MKRLTSALLASVIAASPLWADPVDDMLVLNGDDTLVTRTAAPAHIADAFDEVMSGWLFRGTETRAMQADDFDLSLIHI